MEFYILVSKGETLNRSGRLLAPWPHLITSSPAMTVGCVRKLVASVICLKDLAYVNLNYFSIKVKVSMAI